MTIKTPEQIAAEVAGSYFDTYQDSADEVGNDEGQPIVETWPALRECIAAAIEADRAQRQPEPVHPDWQDDADMYRDAASVDITWRGWLASGAQIGYSDAGITGAQAAAMFEAIGRAEEAPIPEAEDYGKYLDQQFWGDH